MRTEALPLGQRQRALFCMGAACLPDLMLLDEPTSALDPDNGKRLPRIIKALAKLAGIGILMVTHDRSLTCGERVIAYDEGQSRARTAAVGNHEIFGYFSEVAPAGAQ